MCWRCFAVGAFAVLACTHEANPACSPDVLVNIDARASLDIAAVINTGKCDSYKQAEDCPALQPVIKRYDAERRVWASCR